MTPIQIAALTRDCYFQGEYEQDSILPSYYQRVNRGHTISDAALSDDESQESAGSAEGSAVASTENPFPDREEDYNAVEDALGPFPEIGAVSLFLGRLRGPDTHYFFRLRGAPEDHEVDMPAVHAIIGEEAYKYMIAHYFTRGSMHMVATFYHQNRNDCAAFFAALGPRGLASRVLSYLWYLLNLPLDEHSDEEGSQVHSNGDVDAGSAAEDDAREAAMGSDERAL
ncbi:hypothetical protein FRC01_004159 [Tulasnella sp. 417]|nr:hypothetical protein FRC01_004159 [Tulasnella sp. 417]